MNKQIQIYVNINECIEAVRELNPEEVFTKADLINWALDNGYILPEENR